MAVLDFCTFPLSLIYALAVYPTMLFSKET